MKLIPRSYDIKLSSRELKRYQGEKWTGLPHDTDHISVVWRGHEMWAVYHHITGAVLTKRGQWLWEMQPSSRTEKFLKLTRYATPQAALRAVRRSFEKYKRMK